MEGRVGCSCLFLGAIIFLALLLVPAASTHNIHSGNLSHPVVPFTFIEGAASKGAVCLDGSLPGYNFDHGFGSGVNSWIVDFPGGSWCDNVESCLQRKPTLLGSSRHMKSDQVNFTGILNKNAQENPDFFNWNKVVIRYCDGASFAGDGEHKEAGLHFRGQRIFTAAMEDLMSKGMRHADQVLPPSLKDCPALLSGGSAGGVAVILHCDKFSTYFPTTTRVKCLSDAGLFMDTVDVSGGHDMRRRVHGVVTLQGVANILPRSCTSRHDPTYCFFPQNLINYVKAPLFILNAAYDVIQVQAGIAPNISDPKGKWSNGCKLNFTKCTPSQIHIIQEFRNRMVNAVQGFGAKSQNGLFIDSCFQHGQSERQETWLSKKSPMIDNMGISHAVGDWYFDRSRVNKIGPPYPYEKTCRNAVYTSSPY